jgi:phosphoribosyl 1,2-cyclic phosphodiesterase
MPSIFRAFSLASGSSGNAVVLDCDEGVVLVDAGLSAKRLLQGLDGLASRLQGVVITHDHTDHVKGAAVFARKHGAPIWMTAGTAAAAEARGAIATRRIFRSGETLAIGGFRIETIPTPHDGAEPVAVVAERKGCRCGILTDLGHPFPALQAILSTLDAVFLESNYDPEMLRRGPYPPWLQARIRSPQGHLANDEAAALVRDHAGDRLKTAILSHLSENNNHPDAALRAFHGIAGARLGKGLRCFAAPRHAACEAILVGGSAA